MLQVHLKQNSNIQSKELNMTHNDMNEPKSPVSSYNEHGEQHEDLMQQAELLNGLSANKFS
jgi:hypothetical protein